ncbi:MAG TPA: PAS domain-containing protein [Desulfotignum sp.]|nr:PAS domain-containing protein [Desulfotignum sp.]
MADTREELQKRLQEAENIVEALRSQEVDAVVTKGNVSLLRLRQTEEKLRKSEEHLRMALQIGEIGTRYLDLQSGKLDMSKRARQIYGLPLEGEVTVDHILNNVHPEDRPEIKKIFSGAEKIAAKFENEHRVIHPDGSEHWVSSRCESFLDAQGKKGFNIGMVVDITEKKTYENQLVAFNQTLEKEVKQRTNQVESQTKHLRALAIRLTRVEHEERKRLARILHDHVQQLLVGARMQVGMLKRCKETVQMHTVVETIDNTLGQAIQTSRSLALDLCPPALQEGGLCGGLRWLATHMQQANEFTIHLDLDDQAEPDDKNVKILLFECARELVLNTIKHADVLEARVSLKKSDDTCIALSVQDKGAGFDPDALKDRVAEEATFGLFSIQQRLTHIGGNVKIASRPGAGTRTTLITPC